MAVQDHAGNEPYDENFYRINHDNSMRRAEIVLPFIQRFIHPQSVIDVGCGAGGWLKIWQKNYHADIYGIDGAYVDKKYLLISDEEFHPANLEERLELNKKFDLAECIEVAEHISPPEP